MIPGFVPQSGEAYVHHDNGSFGTHVRQRLAPSDDSLDRHFASNDTAGNIISASSPPDPTGSHGVPVKGACQFDRCCPEIGVSCEAGGSGGDVGFLPGSSTGPGHQAGRFVPGSRATTVSVQSWWQSAVRVLLQTDGAFKSFFRSLFRKPATLPEGESTTSLWPMPLPYPREYQRGKSSDSVGDSYESFRKGVNLVVLSLNWLFLRRPFVAPPSILIGRRLSKVQWRVVRQVEAVMGIWKNVSPVTAADMGRIAGKIESVEGALGRLAQFELSAFSSLSESDEPKFCSGNSRRSRRRSLIPGLQRVSAGSICGALHLDPSIVAKRIESDRLEFRGEPSFEPSPFLDERSKAIFQSPIQNALQPEDSLVEPPCVKIHSSKMERDKLLAKLDSCGRLRMVSEAEVLVGYQSGLFSVSKDLEKDRLIFDSRPFNTLERPPGRWVKAMASCGPLLDLQLQPHEKCFTSGTDLRDFYYGFKITHERLRRNSLVGPVAPSLYKHFRCYRHELATAARVYFCLNTLAMGDSQAVEIAQTAHLGVLVQAGLVEPSSLLAMDLSISRLPVFTGIVIDDLIVFERVVCNQQLFGNEFSFHGSACLERALEEYRRVGLLPHPKKTFKDTTSSEFWGCQFDGSLGLIQANTKRVIPIMAVTAKILQLGLCSLGLLEVLIGSWTSIFLFRRRLLSLLNLVYQPCQGDIDRKHILRLSPELKEELLLCMCLGVTAVTNLRVTNAEHIYCSDASEWGIAVTRAFLPEWLQDEIHRHKLKKSVWAKLLSPLKALERLRGTLPPADELPDGFVLASHPLWIELGSALSFEEVMRKHIAGNRHINILELRGMIRTEAEAAKEKFPCRFFSLADSQVSLGTWIKGRSSSLGLNQELQQSLPMHIGCGMYSNAGFLPTELNTADDPTRGKSVRAPAKVPEQWLNEPGKDLEVFDAWLDSYGASPYSTSGLPPLTELYDDTLVGREPFRSTSKSKDHFKVLKVDKKLRSRKTEHLEPKSQPPCKKSSENQRRVMESSKVPALSEEGKALVRGIPFEQFLLPKEWKPPTDWRPSRCGALDLYSGAKGVARE